MNIDVLGFFRATFVKLSIPMILSLAFGFLVSYVVPLDGIIGFVVKGISFCMIYCAIIYLMAMNQFERNLIITPIKKIIRIKQ